MLLRNTLRIFFMIIGGILGFSFIKTLTDILSNSIHPFYKIFILFNGILVGCGILFFLSSRIINVIAERLESFQHSISTLTLRELLETSAGIIVGLIIANLISIPAYTIKYVGIIFPILLNIIVINLFYGVFKGKKLVTNEATNKNYKLLDTSAIIDGRILEITKTNFIDGVFLVPWFILQELRHIADSREPDRRAKGRAGLDTLQELQKNHKDKVEILEKSAYSIDEQLEVDIKLIKLAQQLKCRIVTTDYNLNKVATFEGVEVLNVNDLTNATKPMLLPGEEMLVKILKEGKEERQGIGYLENGTMIVVDDAREMIGRTIGVEVTHILQTSSGRIIFSKPKYDIKSM